MVEQLLGDGIYYTYFLRNIRIHQNCFIIQGAKFGLKCLCHKQTLINQYSVLACIYSIIHNFTLFNRDKLSVILILTVISVIYTLLSPIFVS